MGAIAAMEPARLSVEPGGEASVSLRVRNAGTVVDEFTFEVIGAAAGWTVVEPTVLRLLPGVEEMARVVMRPPRSADAAAGDVPFGVKVLSREDPAGSVVEEGVVTVAPFGEVTAELLPRTSQGSRRGRHELAVDNRGNDRLNANVIAFDDDQLLEFEVNDPGLVVDPGSARFTKIDVRPVKRFWRGPNKTLPFHVQVQSDDGIPPFAVDGAMVQRAVVPKWLGKALLALLALLLLLALLWFFLLKPTITSAAEEAADEAASEAAGAAVDAALAGPIAGQQAQIDEQREAVNDVLDRIGETPLPTEGPGTTLVEQPRDVRLSASAPPGSSATQTLTVQEGETLRLTDIVLQNPAGNVGELRIRRGGQVLLAVALQNFRDLDYHFVGPIVFTEGQTLVLEVVCTQVTAEGATTCGAGAYISGTVLSELSPTEEPTG